MFFGSEEEPTKIFNKSFECNSGGEESCPKSMLIVGIRKEIICLYRIFLFFLSNCLEIIIRSWKLNLNLELWMTVDVSHQFLKIFELHSSIHIGEILSYCMHYIFCSIVLRLLFEPRHKLLCLNIQIVTLKSRVIFYYVSVYYWIEIKIPRRTIMEVLDMGKNFRRVSS